jgi:hypothetical protein
VLADGPVEVVVDAVRRNVADGALHGGRADGAWEVTS